jgi:F-type H+-transporting ATPase subunit gamma
MANLKDISRRIKSVKNTQKTTRAMKLVSTAKLKRAEEIAKRSRAYSDKINQVLSSIAYQMNKHKVEGIESRFFTDIPDTEAKKADLIFITADKGLCGGFNYQTIKTVKQNVEQFKANKTKVRMRAIGKKGIEFFKFQGVELFDEKIGLSAVPNYQEAKAFVNKSIEDFLDGTTDQVKLVHNGYVNVITQEIRERRLLPISMKDFEPKEFTSMLDIEPEDDESILESLVRKYVEYNVYYALLDSLAAEHSSRMQAMDAATNNAKEMASQLTLQYNKARQEAITTELVEIISGVESMKKK